MTTRKRISMRTRDAVISKIAKLSLLTALESLLLKSGNTAKTFALINLTNNIIQLFNQELHTDCTQDPRITLDIPKELTILWKQLRNQPLSDTETNYTQRAELYGIKIDVVKELFNGLYWSAVFAFGRETADNFKQAAAHHLSSQLPALTGVAYAQWFGRGHLEQLAETLLARINLDPATKQELKALLPVSLGLLSKLILPEVHRDGQGFRYQLAGISKKVLPPGASETQTAETLRLHYTAPDGKKLPVEIRFQTDAANREVVTVIAPDKVLATQLSEALQSPSPVTDTPPKNDKLCRTELFPEKLGPISWGAIQGNADDCYLMAALSSAADRNPKQITDMIQNSEPDLPDLCPEDKVYMVRFYNLYAQLMRNEQIPQWYEVDTKLQTDTANPQRTLYAQTPDLDKNGKPEIGFALIEKAWVSYCKTNEPFTHMFFGTPANEDSAQNNEMSVINGGIPAYACSAISGGTPYFLNLKSATLDHVKLLVKAPEVNCLVASGSAHSPYESHAYTLLDVRGTDTIILRDPWGNDGHGGTRRSGQISIPFSEFQANFEDLGYTVTADQPALN